MISGLMQGGLQKLLSNFIKNLEKSNLSFSEGINLQNVELVDSSFTQILNLPLFGLEMEKSHLLSLRIQASLIDLLQSPIDLEG